MTDREWWIAFWREHGNTENADRLALMTDEEYENEQNFEEEKYLKRKRNHH